MHGRWRRVNETTIRGGLEHVHLHVRLLSDAFHRLYITPRQLLKAHHASSLLPLGLFGTRWRVVFPGASASVVGCRRRVVVVGDGARGSKTVQEDAGLVEKVESLEDISVRHTRWIWYLVLVLVLVVFAHDLTIEIG